MPLPGVAVSLAMTVRSRFFWRTSSSTTRSGVPTAMKPPIRRLAPSGIISTDRSSEIVCMLALPRLLFCPPADRQGRAADLRRVAEAVERDVAAGSSERTRNPEADAAGRPGDDRNFSLGHRPDVVLLMIRQYGGPE